VDRVKGAVFVPIIPISDYERDPNDYPRSKHWTPEWLE